MKYKKGERVLLATDELFWCCQNQFRSDKWIFDGTIARIIDVVDKYYYLLYHDGSTGSVQDIFLDGTQYYADSWIKQSITIKCPKYLKQMIK